MPIWKFVLSGRGLKERYPEARVFDYESGQCIGSAQSYTYGGTAWAVSTGPFGGYVPFDSKSIEYVTDGEQLELL